MLLPEKKDSTAILMKAMKITCYVLVIVLLTVAILLLTRVLWTTTSSKDTLDKVIPKFVPINMGFLMALVNYSHSGYSPYQSPKEEEKEEEEKDCNLLLPRDNHESNSGDRLIERKCSQYIWEMNHKDKFIEYNKCNVSGYLIVGGKDAPPREFPHMVALGWKVKNATQRYKFQCGATLISEFFVITAGHCTYSPLEQDKSLQEAKPSIARLGALNIGEVDENTKDKKISEIIKHPNYKSPKPYYDLALMKLMEKVVFTKTIHPACVSTSMVPEQSNVIATGWGIKSFGSSQISDHLQMATLKIIDRDQCITLNRKRLNNRHWTTIQENQICAGVLAGGTDTCQGDSGGPLQVKVQTTSGSMYRILAVVSTGYKCALKNEPSINANVVLPEVLDWIEKTVWPEEALNKIK